MLNDRFHLADRRRRRSVPWPGGRRDPSAGCARRSAACRSPPSPRSSCRHRPGWSPAASRRESPARPCARRFHHDECVLVVWRRNEQDVRFFGIEHRPEIGIGLQVRPATAPLLDERLDQRLHEIADRHQFDIVRQPVNRRRVRIRAARAPAAEPGRNRRGNYPRQSNEDNAKRFSSPRCPFHSSGSAR